MLINPRENYEHTKTNKNYVSHINKCEKIYFTKQLAF